MSREGGFWSPRREQINVSPKWGGYTMAHRGAGKLQIITLEGFSVLMRLMMDLMW